MQSNKCTPSLASASAAAVKNSNCYTDSPSPRTETTTIYRLTHITEDLSLDGIRAINLRFTSYFRRFNDSSDAIYRIATEAGVNQKDVLEVSDGSKKISAASAK